MRTPILALALLLTACSQPAPEAPPPAVEAPAPAPPAPALETGEMGAMSNTAMSITGSLTVTATGLQFENGFSAATELIGPVDAAAPVAEGGQSFAEAAPGPTSLQVELRRILPQAPQQLCGDTPPTYVAIAHDDPLTGLTLIFFTGADAPGPQAHDSRLCATFSYGVD